jgi:hypothetical protein
MDIKEIHTLNMAEYFREVTEELKSEYGIQISPGKQRLLISKFSKDQYLTGFPAQRAAKFFAELYPEYRK